jgi:hypothetical protein
MTNCVRNANTSKIVDLILVVNLDDLTAANDSLMINDRLYSIKVEHSSAGKKRNKEDDTYILITQDHYQTTQNMNSK